MIVISNPKNFSDEIKYIKTLFKLGIPKFHLRKPDFTISETLRMLEQIGLEHHSKIVLHQHYELANIFNISQIHLSENQRIIKEYPCTENLSLSTSVHNIEGFNSLDSMFKYAFISPIFPSISKPNYSVETHWQKELEKRTNYKTKLIALGGIDASKIKDLKSMGFDDYALLGAIWTNENGIDNFKKCLQLEKQL